MVLVFVFVIVVLVGYLVLEIISIKFFLVKVTPDGLLQSGIKAQFFTTECL
jgi:hypothetical protein